MSAMLGKTVKRAGSGEENDVYTALLGIATAFVVVAMVCVAYQFGSHYGFEYLFRSTPNLTGV